VNRRLTPCILVRPLLAVLGLCVALSFTSLPALAANVSQNKDAVAVIIGNKDYAGSVPDVDFAHNDAEAMKRFVIEVLGFREGNIIDLRDATQAQLFSAFGNEHNHEAKLWSWVKQGKSDVVVFYSGHGVPGLQDQRGYLLPVDADPDTPEFNGYPVDLLYANLAKLKARSVTVYLDACFSGESPKGRLTKAASNIGLSHVPENVDAGITVVTAARGDQLASWDKEAKHGLFTHYLLEGLYGAADGAGYGNGDGDVTLAEVQAYLDNEMTYAARRTYLRRQQVTVRGDEGLVLASVPEGGAAERPAIASSEPLVAAPIIHPLDLQMSATRNANVRAGPGTSHDRLQTLSSGDEVNVTGRTEDGEWYRIALAGGRIGYVFNNLLEEKRAGPSVGESFRDCPDCPEMMVVPEGEFMMGSSEDELLNWERPMHHVSVHQPFAIGKYEVTRRQYSEFMKATGRTSGGCWFVDRESNEHKEDNVRNWRWPGYTQTEDDPVVCVSQEDTKAYTEWLSRETGHAYRLPSEAEWEYAARAGTTTEYYWGNDVNESCRYGNFYDKSGYDVGEDIPLLSSLLMSDCNDGYVRTSPVGTYMANGFGLHDILGNVAEWVEDCWNESYFGAPSDTNVWTTGDCRVRILRGGSWGVLSGADSTTRRPFAIEESSSTFGFRIARTLLPQSGSTQNDSTIARLSEPDFTVMPLNRQMSATKNAIVRSGPGTSHDRLTSLSSGDHVDVTGNTKDGEWYRVALAEGRIGYVLKNFLEELRTGPSVGEVFRDCADCPELVVVPAGGFWMGSPESEDGHSSSEGPVHSVAVRQPFAIGKYEVTSDEWGACVADGGCNNYRPKYADRGSLPVTGVSYWDAKAYTEWLSRKTGHAYRLPSEAEWEYAARAGTEAPYHSGEYISSSRANYGHTIGIPGGKKVAVGSYPSNAFGLHDVHGNVSEWTEDCWSQGYAGAPADSDMRTVGDCPFRVLRGGSWKDADKRVRSASRTQLSVGRRNYLNGIRVARALPPSGDYASNAPNAVLRESTIMVLPLHQRMRAATNANVRSGPSTSHDRLKTLSRGDKVTVTGRTEDGEWYRVDFAGGRVGYVFKNLLKRPLEWELAFSFPDCSDCLDIIAYIGTLERDDVAGLLRYIQPLSEKGNAAAQFILGVMSLAGEGVAQDAAEAKRLFHKSADQGSAILQFKIGNAFLFSRRAARDRFEAVKWYRKAADQGSADAQLALGSMYSAGEGAEYDDVEYDEAEALKWYRKAADQGDAEAQYVLGLHYYFDEDYRLDPSEAVKWYRKAADQGHIPAQLKLGSMYEEGEGVEYDATEAVKWYRKAADQGNMHAQSQLGPIYEKGEGVARDYIQALMFRTLAARSGSWLEAAPRDDLAKLMTREQVAEAGRLAREWEPK
jgi:formylglycine-generating enzyme required for sulfatase activity/TPR repeat protein